MGHPEFSCLEKCDRKGAFYKVLISDAHMGTPSLAQLVERLTVEV